MTSRKMHIDQPKGKNFSFVFMTIVETYFIGFYRYILRRLVHNNWRVVLVVIKATVCPFLNPYCFINITWLRKIQRPPTNLQQRQHVRLIKQFVQYDSRISSCNKCDWVSGSWSGRWLDTFKLFILPPTGLDILNYIASITNTCLIYTWPS